MDRCTCHYWYLRTDAKLCIYLVPDLDTALEAFIADGYTLADINVIVVPS